MELARYPWQRIAARMVEGIDPPLLVLILSLSLLGFAALFSASYENPGRVVNQLVHLSRRARRHVGRRRRSRRRR